MGRQTVFPGLRIDSIEARTSGMATEVDIPRESTVKQAFDRLRRSLRSLNPVFDTDLRLIYSIEVQSYSRFAASTKARVFVKMKNPFEADFVKVDNIRRTDSRDALLPGRNGYMVRVEVRK